MDNTRGTSSINMTSGSPFKLILTFALPLLLGNALQQLYNMVDSVVVGRYVGNTALASVGLAFPVIFMLSSLFMGMGVGAMVLVSQYFGAGENDNLRRTVDTVYTGLIVGAVPLSLLGIALTGVILDLLNVPPDMRAEAYTYLAIVMGGIIGSLGFNLNAGIMQGVGDSKTPLLFLAVACLLNIALDLLLVLVIPLGVAGVAIATIIAQAFSWIFGIVYINKKYPQLAIRPFVFRFDKRIFSQIIRLGLPAGIQMAMFSFSVLMMTRLVNSHGSAYAAGFAASNKLDTFVFLPIQSISTAVTTYTGQNIGAGRLDRVRNGTRSALIMSVGFSILGLLVMPAGPYLMQLFSSDALVVEAGMAFVNRIIPFYSLLAVMFVLNSVMRGAGESIIPMVAAVISQWAARVPAAYLFAHFLGRDNMHFAYPAGWMLGLIITIPFFLGGRWKHKALTQAGMNAEKQLK